MHRRLVFALLICACAATVDAAQAADAGLAAWVNEVKVGILYHDADNIWSGFRLESGADINAEVIFAPKVKVLWGAIRPALGGSLNTAGGTSKAYADLRYQFEHGRGVFFGVGIGATIHNGELTPTRHDRKALGARVLFHIPAELGFRFAGRHAVSVYFDHISNGNLADDNEGLDTLGVRYGYRFLASATAP